MAVAVPVVLAVGVVVPALVADQVLEREAVVRGDVVDGGPGMAAGRLVDLARPGHGPGQLRQLALVAAPEGADRIAELVVPLAPSRRKGADPVAAVPEVPGLRDQLDPREHRILAYGAQEPGPVRDLVGLAGEAGREIEPESVDVVGVDPVPQGIEDHLQHARMVEVEGVAGAGRVPVLTRVLRLELVVARVVDAAQGQGRAEVAALGGVVVDDVEDDLDPGRVQRPDRAA